MLLYRKDGVQKTVFAFAYGDTLRKIAGTDDISVEILATAGSFKSMTVLKDKEVENSSTELFMILLSSILFFVDY